MQRVYDPFVIRRMAEGRMFFVNPQMPFENFLDCFQMEQPFFLVAQLNDGRFAITPNATVIPQTILQAGFGPQDLLPTETEYVTMRGTYPVILTAHPVHRPDEWLRKFERLVVGFAKQTLADYICCSYDFIPLKFGRKVAQTQMPAQVHAKEPIEI